MANFVYNEAKRLALATGFNWATLDIRVLLVMTNTTADTEDDVNFLSDITTLDEYDGAAYARQPIVGESIVEDTVNNRAEAQSSTPTLTWATLGAGTRQCQAMVIYIHAGADTVNIPLAYVDVTDPVAGFPFTGNGSNVVITMNAQGWIQAA